VAVLTHERGSVDARALDRLPVDVQKIVEHELPVENVYSAMRRLRDSLLSGPGAIVANDWLELATAGSYNLRKAVVNITHGDYDYYYDLATKFEAAIDIFVAHSAFIHERLCSLLPHRTADIRHVPIGVTIPRRWRTTHTDERLRIVYAGRFDCNKGVQHLPAIAALLAGQGVLTSWTFFGDGPDYAAVQRAWPGAVPASWRGAQQLRVVRGAFPDHDVFVLASRNEGFPVTLLEAGAAGVVPVSIDLKSGIGEVIDDGVTGFRRCAGDVEGFAGAIASLAEDRTLLGTMSEAVRELVASRFDARTSAPAYHAAIEDAIVRRAERPWKKIGPFVGSGLDRAWIPDAITRAFRPRAN
jgi:glycosyltransferase involved in cell wall biosynthesis